MGRRHKAKGKLKWSQKNVRQAKAKPLSQQPTQALSAPQQHNPFGFNQVIPKASAWMWEPAEEPPTIKIPQRVLKKIKHFQSLAGQNEMGGFGICKAKDPLSIIDFALIEQKVNWGQVDFDDLNETDK